MGFIDVDSHVIEVERVWDFLEPAEARFRPWVMSSGAPKDGPVYSGVNSRASTLWVVGDSWATRPRTDGNHRGNANVFVPGATNMEDPAARAADLDALGIEAQLLLSSFFIGVELPNPLAEAALTRSYNRWMADSVKGFEHRFPWAIIPPLQDMEIACEELEFGKAHGAVGAQFRGKECGQYLSDPYFYPFYEKAEELDMAVLVHLGESVRRGENIPIGKLIATPAAFIGTLRNIAVAFHAVVSSDLYKHFPKLRFGFIEAGASWAPYVLQQHSRFVSSWDHFSDIRRPSPAELEERNIFIACQADEDLPYLTSQLGENVLCIGTDYAHNDAGSELGAHTAIMERTDLSDEVKRKIVDTNGRKLLGLDPVTTASDLLQAVPERLPNVYGAPTEDHRPIMTAQVGAS